MKKYELVNKIATALASKEGMLLEDASPVLQNKYISFVLTMFATLESLGFTIAPSEEKPTERDESITDAILHKWCEEFTVEPNWPENISLEEKLDRYFLPLLQEDLTLLEKDREYYQNRFYVMQWAFRKFLRTYEEVAEELKRANIRFLADDLLEDLAIRKPS